MSYVMVHDPYSFTGIRILQDDRTQRQNDPLDLLRHQRPLATAQALIPQHETTFTWNHSLLSLPSQKNDFCNLTPRATFPSAPLGFSLPGNRGMAGALTPPPSLPFPSARASSVTYTGSLRPSYSCSCESLCSLQDESGIDGEDVGFRENSNRPDAERGCHYPALPIPSSTISFNPSQQQQQQQQQHGPISASTFSGHGEMDKSFASVNPQPLQPSATFLMTMTTDQGAVGQQNTHALHPHLPLLGGAQQQFASNSAATADGSIHLASPAGPCAHQAHWKSLRVKRGIRHLLCRLCGARWRAHPIPLATTAITAAAPAV